MARVLSAPQLGAQLRRDWTGRAAEEGIHLPLEVDAGDSHLVEGNLLGLADRPHLGVVDTPLVLVVDKHHWEGDIPQEGILLVADSHLVAEAEGTLQVAEGDSPVAVGAGTLAEVGSLPGVDTPIVEEDSRVAVEGIQVAEEDNLLEEGILAVGDIPAEVGSLAHPRVGDIHRAAVH